MAKLFKTISLEDRYKDSRFNNAPVKPKFVIQGTVVLQAIKSTKEFESILLKSLPSAQEKNSIILKSIKGNIDVTKKAPTISLVFRSPIGLVDRIKQPHTKPIAQSPAIGLSDLYNNLIKITPFGILNQISKVVVKPATTMLSQGLSYITVNIPSYDSLLLQGTFFNSGAYYSNIVPIISITSQQLSQGVTQTLSTPVLTASVLLAQGTTLQGGSITTIQPSSSTNTILLKYGTYWFLNQLQITRPLDFITQSEDVKLQKPRNLIKLVNVEIYAPNKVLKQGTINIRNRFPTRFQPKREGPILRLAVFAADRALAFFSPRVKHGSADLSKSETSKGYFTKAGILFSGNTFDDTQFDYQDRSEQLTLQADAVRTTPQAPSDSQNLDFYLSELNLESPTDLNDGDRFPVNYRDLELRLSDEVPYGLLKLPVNDREKLDAYLDPKSTPRPFLRPGGESVSTERNTPTAQPTVAINQSPAVGLIGNALNSSTSRYFALTYEKITETGDDLAGGFVSAVNPILQDFRDKASTFKGIQIKSNRRYIPTLNNKAKTTKEFADEFGNVEQRSPLNATQNKSDFIKLSINGFEFRAYITSLSDGLQPKFKEVGPFVGVTSTQQLYDGVSRNGTIGFKVVALSQNDHLIIVDKLRKLANTLKNINAEKRLKVGNFLDELVYIESFKLDVQMTDTSWDIQTQLPHVIDASISYKVATGFNSNSAQNLAPFVQISELKKLGSYLTGDTNTPEELWRADDDKQLSDVNALQPDLSAYDNVVTLRTPTGVLKQTPVDGQLGQFVPIRPEDSMTPMEVDDNIGLVAPTSRYATVGDLNAGDATLGIGRLA